jgi:acetyl-CoA synthetase
MSSPTAPAWRPTADYLERSRVARLMRRLQVATINDLRRRSVEDPDWFWDAVVEDLDIPFATPYRQVRDVAGGIAHAQWFNGGRINLADGCVDRWARDTAAKDRTAAVAESEDRSCTSLTFAELGAQVDALASALMAAGVGDWCAPTHGRP